MRKRTDPTTHMNAPAAAWSLAAERPKSLGTAAYVGYATLPANVRDPATAVFTRSAPTRYGMSSQREMWLTLGHGWMIGNQNSSDVMKKQACSTSCQPLERSANS